MPLCAPLHQQIHFFNLGRSLSWALLKRRQGLKSQYPFVVSSRPTCGCLIRRITRHRELTEEL